MAVPELPESRYATAASTRARSIGDIALDKYDAGSSGVIGSYAQAAKEKLAASSMKMKERFDPLNMVQGLTGSKLLTGAAGKLMGRSSQDVDYFRDKAAQRDLAGTSEGAKSAGTSKEATDNQKKLLESQIKINNLILTAKTILYPKDEIIDGLTDLYDLIDERMPVGGSGSGGRYIPGKPNQPPTPQSQPAAGGPSLLESAAGGGMLASAGRGALNLAKNVGSQGLNLAKSGARGGMNLLKGGANLARTGLSAAGQGIGAVLGQGALGAAAVGATGALAAGGTLAAAGLAIEDDNIVDDATPKDPPKELQGPEFAYLKDLTSYNPKPFLDRNYDGDDGTRSEKADQFIMSLANKIPEEDRADFNKMLEHQVLGKEVAPNMKMKFLRDLINNYMDQKVAALKSGVNPDFKAVPDLEQTSQEQRAERASRPTANEGTPNVPKLTMAQMRNIGRPGKDTPATTESTQVPNAVATPPTPTENAQVPSAVATPSASTPDATPVTAAAPQDLNAEIKAMSDEDFEQYATVIAKAGASPAEAKALQADPRFAKFRQKRRAASDASDAALGASGKGQAVRGFDDDSGATPVQSVTPVPVVENNMNNLDQARAATAATAQSSAPIIVNAGGGGGQAQASSPQTPQVVPPPGSATTNGSTNRFEDKLMGGSADYLP